MSPRTKYRYEFLDFQQTEEIMNHLLFLIFTCAFYYEKTPDVTKHKLWSKNDTLKIEYRGEADLVNFKMFGGLSLALNQKEKGIFEGRLPIPGLDSALFLYAIEVYKTNAKGESIRVPYEPVGEDNYFKWTGKNRDAPCTAKLKLDGILKDTVLFSKHLKENRKITMYLPKNYTMIKDISIVYTTDGHIVKDYFSYVEKLIDEHKIRPVILIGVHSSDEQIDINGKKHPPVRYIEYVDNGLQKEIFNNHQLFFLEEVVSGIGGHVSRTSKTGNNYLYGFSNGGAFCMQTGITRPEIFREIIAFSTADYITQFYKPIEFKFTRYPAFYLAAGRYESFYDGNISFYQRMKAQPIDVSMKELICGHDHWVWREEFLRYLVKKMPAANRMPHPGR